jgi:hypothetical protein
MHDEYDIEVLRDGRTTGFLKWRALVASANGAWAIGGGVGKRNRVRHLKLGHEGERVE